MRTSVFSGSARRLRSDIVNKILNFGSLNIDALRMKFPHAKIVLTLGGSGSRYIDRDQVICQDAFRVKAGDTTAAGDTFTDFFLSGMISGRSVKEALQLASRAAAIAVSRAGAAPSIPTMEEVLAAEKQG